jgi:hypothetical protein
VTRAVLLLLVGWSVAAGAEDAGVPAGPSLLEELDAAALAPPPGSPAPSTNPVARFFQSLNPDLSVLVDGVVGYSERAPLRLAGDDPDLGGDTSHPAAGFMLQELEVGFQAVVDPYFRADVFLTIPNLKGLEVEEAVISTTSLPADLQVRVGVLRSALGRQNGQHLHSQDFTRRPLLNAAYLGTDGLRAPGVQVSWLAPLPFFLQLNLEAFSVAPADAADPPTSFGGGARTDLTWAAELKAFAPITESLSASAGLDFATGLAAGHLDPLGLAGPRTFLYGGNLYVKWKPPNEVEGAFSLAWTTEYFVRKLGRYLDGGVYTQLVAQVARRWTVGLREDVLGVPASAVQPLTSKTALSVGFVATEFARLRAQVEREFSHGGAAGDSWGGYLVVEISMGAHGAHAF